MEPKEINLQDIHESDYKKLYPGRYCKVHYYNTEIRLRVNANFDNNTFNVFINDELCIGHHMDKNVFTE